MGSDQSTQLPAGAPGSEIKSQRDEDIPYTSYSISKPISGGEWSDLSQKQVSNVKTGQHSFQICKLSFFIFSSIRLK